LNECLADAIDGEKGYVVAVSCERLPGGGIAPAPAGDKAKKDRGERCAESAKEEAKEEVEFGYRLEGAQGLCCVLGGGGRWGGREECAEEGAAGLLEGLE